MDPTSTLTAIYEAKTLEEKAEHAANLLRWLDDGGFMPRDRDGGKLLMSRGQLKRYCRTVRDSPRRFFDDLDSPRLFDD